MLHRAEDCVLQTESRCHIYGPETSFTMFQTTSVSLATHYLLLDTNLYTLVLFMYFITFDVGQQYGCVR